MTTLGACTESNRSAKSRSPSSQRRSGYRLDLFPKSAPRRRVRDDALPTRVNSDPGKPGRIGLCFNINSARVAHALDRAADDGNGLVRATRQTGCLEVMVVNSV